MPPILGHIRYFRNPTPGSRIGGPSRCLRTGPGPNHTERQRRKEWLTKAYPS